MKKNIFFTLIFFLNSFVFGQIKDTVNISELNIKSFKIDNNFIESKGEEFSVTSFSASSIVSSVSLKKDLIVRGIEFYFGSSDLNTCDEFISKLLIFDENLTNIISENEIYYIIDSSLGQKKIFDLEKYNIKLSKNKLYYIGLEFEPSESCKKFIFEAVNNKKMKTIIDLSIKKSTKLNTFNDFGIKYKLYYK